MSEVESGNIALIKGVFDPLEKGESQDIGPLFNLFSDDAVFRTAAGEARGKAAVIQYFINSAELLEFNQFIKPLEYYGAGNRVVVLGFETVKVRETGELHEGDFAFVFDIIDGQIIRAINIQDISGFAKQASAAIPS